MPKAMTLVRTAKGLQSQYNQVNAAEGALLEAQNVEIKREGVISKVRGFNRYGNKLNTASDSLFEYKDRLILHEGSTIHYDSDGAGTWTSWDGSFSVPATDVKIHAIEENGVLLFSTYYGFYRTDALAVSPSRAGIPTGLMPVVTKSGTGLGWFSADTALGYKILWGREDLESNLLMGAASFRKTLTNSKNTSLAWTRSGATVTVTHTAHGYSASDTITIADSSETTPLPNGNEVIATVPTADTYTITGVDSGAASGTCTDYKEFDVTLSAKVPDDIVEGDFYEVYRTQMTKGAATEPGDRFYKVFRGGVNSDDVLTQTTGLAWARATATITVTHTAHGLSNGDSVKVYSSSSEAAIPDGDYTIANKATDTYEITGIDAGDASGTCSIQTGGTITFTDLWGDTFLGVELYTNANRETITQQNSRPPYAQDIALFKGYVWYANTKKPETVLLRLLDISGIVDNTDFITWTLGGTTRTYTFSTAENQADNKFQRYTAGIDSENVRDTANSLCRMINGDPLNPSVYAYYVSGTDDPPGYMAIEMRTVNSAAFEMRANSGTPSGAWSPELPTSGDDVSSDSDDGPNRLYHSKFQEPEHVPDFNYEEIGGRSNEIKRILPLRDSLIVLGTEGVWRVSGEDEASLVYKQLDPSVKIRAPEAAVVLNNAVYCLTTQGVVKITESGTSIISRPIEEDLKPFLNDADESVGMHAVAYESERKYMLWVTDTENTIYQYNYLTRSWTTRLKVCKCAHVLRDDDVLYAGSGDPYILQERKNLDANSDYVDELISETLDSVGVGTDPDGDAVTTCRLTWDIGDCATAPAAGWQVWQGSLVANVLSVEDLGSNVYEMTLDRVVAFTAAACSIYIGISSRVRWAPEIAGNAGAMKQFIYGQLYLESLSNSFSVSPWRYRMGFSTDVYTTETWADYFDLTELTGGAVLRSMVPRECQRCRALNLLFTHNRCGERFDLVNVAFSTRIYGDRTAVATP